MPETTRTTCPYCGVGCGVLARTGEAGLLDISGDPGHPANLGRLCSKGAALGETLSLEGRLLHPRIGQRRAGWDEALDRVAAAFMRTIAEQGPDGVAFYLSGQLLIEDYYVANKLMKGFIGSANIDTNSRLCMASAVAGHRRAFGSDTVPGVYADLEEADLVVLVGSNLAWCHPVLHQRLIAAREKRGTKIAVVDPRVTASCDQADLHLALAPGSDVALFNGLLAELDARGLIDQGYVARHTEGLAAALDEARRFDLLRVSALTRLPAREIAAFHALFAATERVVTVFSQGVNQSSAGTDKVNAILNCHLATGRLGRPGMGPFSVTGQPNAMGGREVGGLATMLAAHMEFGDPRHRRIVSGFWRAPRLAAKPGLKAVDLFRAVEAGRVKALWIMGSNPADTMPDADAVRRALRACPFVVVSDICERTGATALAHVLLPSLAWGEKSGTVSNSERRLSRQRAFLPAPGEARADWEQLAEAARRMGFGEAFGWRSPSDIFREYAELTALENDGARDLDLGGVASLDAAAYDSLEPFQWPRRRGEGPRETRFFADGRFYHPDGKARFVPTPYRAPASALDAKRPFALNTGRIRDQWHTMTRTGKAARLMGHIGEPFVEIHPRDAARLGIADADIVEVESARASALLRAWLTPRVAQGALFAPMHWTDEFASRARIDALVGPAADPVSGQPELKFTPVAVKRFEAAWHGFLVSRRRPRLDGLDYWALAPGRAGFRCELADSKAIGEPEAFARARLALAGEAEVVAYRDLRRGRLRVAAFEAGRFVGAVFAAPGPVALAREALAARLGAAVAVSERLALLAGRAGDSADKGAIVCACFEVGRHEILEAARSGAASVAAIGERLGAGANCGSCRGEISRLLALAAAPLRAAPE